jgi:hypothetical protein
LAKNLTTAFGLVGLYTNTESVISHLPTFFTEGGLITKEPAVGDDDDIVRPVPPLPIKKLPP